MNIGNLVLKSESMTAHLLKSPESRLASRIGEAFAGEGVKVSGDLIGKIVDFARVIYQISVYKKLRSKRQVGTNLDFRIGTIRRIVAQIKRDKNYFRCLETDNCIESLLFVALIEKANLIFESDNKGDFRDTQILGFHLWILKNHLTKEKIEKPVETLALILEKSGALRGLKIRWKAATIYNRCAQVQSLLNRSLEAGACHKPLRVGQWPKTNSQIFVKILSGDCGKCEKAWKRVLLVNSRSLTPIDRAAKEIAKELPECSGLINKMLSSLRSECGEGMSLMKILNRLPQDLRGVFPLLF